MTPKIIGSDDFYSSSLTSSDSILVWSTYGNVLKKVYRKKLKGSYISPY
jgi:hypothetical protein